MNELEKELERAGYREWKEGDSLEDRRMRRRVRDDEGTIIDRCPACKKYVYDNKPYILDGSGIYHDYCLEDEVDEDNE